MILSAKENYFNRNLDIAVKGNTVTAAWVAWEYGTRELICLRNIYEDLSMSDIKLLDCREYSPGQLKVLTSDSGEPTIFWTGYKDAKGTLLWSRNSNNSEVVPVLENFNCGNFSVIIDNKNTIWIAIEIWSKKNVSIVLLCYDGNTWKKINLPCKTSFSLRPVLTVSNDGTIIVAWDEYDGKAYRIGSVCLKEGKFNFIKPLHEKNHWLTLPSVCSDSNGNSIFISYCKERLVELDGGHANYHSRIIIAKLNNDTHKWENIGASCIDYAMNPWMAGYAGRRRISSIVPKIDGGAWVFFEEKIDPASMSPGPGRLIMREVDSNKEKIILEGQSFYHVAPEPLDNGNIIIASWANNKFNSS